MKKVFLIVLFFASVATFAQNEEEKIKWQEGYKLQWSDFKGAPPANHDFHANTSSGMTYSFSYGMGRSGIKDFTYEVYSTFNPKKSWVKKGLKDDHLLAHEQLHFDISELHARILKQKLQEYVPSSDPKEDLKKLYEDTMKMREEMQTLFDKETRHSLDKEASKRWQEFVQTELEKYQSYSS